MGFYPFNSIDGLAFVAFSFDSLVFSFLFVPVAKDARSPVAGERARAAAAAARAWFRV